LTNPEQYNPTVTGILFFSEDPHRFIPEASILVTRFKGIDGRDILRTQELTGPVGVLSEETLTLIRSWIQQDYHLQGAQLIAEIPIPEKALREAIINALLHRKYTIVGAIKIAIYNDRIEVFSPGAFPGLVDMDNIGDGTTYLRNPHLMRLARHLGLVEKLGTGIRLIFASCKEAGLSPPKYFEGGDFVKVTFEFEKKRQVGQSDQEAILYLVDDRVEVSASEIRDFLGTSRNTASRKLGELVEAGELIRTGKGPSVRYTRKKP
jgi:ATP-dependent DNA helicase RecG